MALVAIRKYGVRKYERQKKKHKADNDRRVERMMMREPTFNIQDRSGTGRNHLEVAYLTRLKEKIKEVIV